MAKLFVKKGDTVVVIAGKEKGKTAKVLGVSPKTNKVLVENVNVVTKHQRRKSQEDKGGIIKKSAPVCASNLMVVCPDCGKATRVAHKEIDGKKVRICKKCGASLDKAMAKTVKKLAKQEKKSSAKEEVKKEEVKVEEPKAETTKKSSTIKKTTSKTTTAKKTTTKKTAIKEEE